MPPPPAPASAASPSSAWRLCALCALPVWVAALRLCAPVPAYAEPPAAAGFHVGLGLSQRDVSVPSAEGPRRLDFGPAPAVAFGFAGDVRHGGLALGLRLNYRTSLAGRVRDAVAGPDADMSRTAVRSQMFETGVRPGVSFGMAGRALGLALFAGYNLRAFGSVAVLRVPRFSLHGPVLRFELDLPLTVGHMRLRLAPEGQWVVSLTKELRDLAAIQGALLSFGGEAQLLLPLGERFSMSLRYREARAWARSRYTQDFHDSERYLLLEAAYRVR